MAATLRALVERTHDFTDSAYTSHDHRQRILALAERIAYELERLVAVAMSVVSKQLDSWLLSQMSYFVLSVKTMESIMNLLITSSS